MKHLKRVLRVAFCRLFVSVVIVLQAAVMADDVDPATLKAIGGYWFVSSTEPAVYYYKDGARYLDLFSYHAKDSNKDGISNVVIRHDATHLIVDSQGYPNHPTAIFPNSGNPNQILVQKFQFRFPLQPKLSDRITRLPMGPIGMALNGVVFFNPFEAGGMNAVEGYSEVWLDSCCGHPQQHGVYHYHKYPVCVKSPFRDDGKQHSPVIGLAFDGFPVYGPYESAGEFARDVSGEHSLDVCNGHSDDERGYHYHVTPGRFPYVIGGYHGEIEGSNFRGPQRLGYGAIEDNSSGESQLPQVISSVTPGSAIAGKTHQIVIQLDPSRATRRPIPDEQPDWVQIGPFEATNIQRDGNRVTCDVAIPADVAAGVLMDCHVEFANNGRRMVLKANEIFRVTVETDP